MTTFKEYVEKSLNKVPSIETFFGSHSRKNKVPSIETSFGSHSNKKSLTEKTEPQDRHEPTLAQHTDLHTETAPLNSSKLSSDETEAVTDYTDNSTPINGMLHRHASGHTISDHAKQHYGNTATHLDSALEKHETTAPMHVYTGIKFSPAKHFKKVDGKVPQTKQMHMPAFTSTSTSLETAKGFSDLTSHPNDDRHGVDSETDERKHVLRIHVPAGSHAMSLMKHSFVPGEREILLHRGHTIEVHHMPEKVDDHTFLWHAKVISHTKADLSKPAE